MSRIGLRTQLAIALCSVAVLGIALTTLFASQGVHPRLDDTARARLELRGREARVAWRAVRGRAPLEAAVILVLREGDLLRVAGGKAHRVDPQELLELDLSSGRARLLVRGIEVRPPRGARLAWPVPAWNPYRQDGQGGPARARLSWPIGRRETEVVFRAPRSKTARRPRR